MGKPSMTSSVFQKCFCTKRNNLNAKEVNGDYYRAGAQGDKGPPAHSFEFKVCFGAVFWFQVAFWGFRTLIGGPLENPKKLSPPTKISAYAHFWLLTMFGHRWAWNDPIAGQTTDQEEPLHLEEWKVNPGPGGARIVSQAGFWTHYFDEQHR